MKKISLDNLPDNILTICIPTYKRFSILNDEITRLNECGIFKYCKILIVNDSESSDIIDDKNLCALGDRIKIIDNGRNLGYAASFIKILENISTKYGLVVADDDKINIDSIFDLYSYLISAESDIIVAQWGDQNSSGIKGVKDGIIEFRFIRSAFNHAPGIVYRRGLIDKYRKILKSELDNGGYAFKFYPQVLLAYISYADNTMEFLNLMIGAYSPNGPVPSDLKDSLGRSYVNPIVAFQIRLNMIDFLEKYLIINGQNNLTAKARDEVSSLCVETYAIVDDGLFLHANNLIGKFRAGALKIGVKYFYSSFLELLKYYRRRWLG